MTLILIPGLMCDAALWHHQSQHLAEVTDCVMPDTRGADSIEGLARAVLAAAPAQFALAGLSMGGIIAHAIMAIAPARVIRLALIGTTARADTSTQTARRQQLIALAKQGRFREITPLLLPALLHPARRDEAGLRDTVIEMANRVGEEAFLKQVTAVMNRPDRRAQLRDYRVPTLIVCGREDAITTLDMHAEMAAGIPGSELAIIEDCGHLSTLERPQAVTALLRLWLSRKTDA